MSTRLVAKAAQLMLHDKVDLQAATYTPDGTVVEAVGVVYSSTSYSVRINADGTVTCSCQYGRHNTGSHSHDIALRMEAERIRNRP